jgi:hypothetical protein
MHDLTVNLVDRPGSLAQLGETLGAAGINIEGLCGVPGGGEAVVHLLIEDPQAARNALTAAGIECGAEKEVEVVSMVDEPGELGRHMRRVADAGVNIDLVYLATNTRLVLGSPDLAALYRALHSTS